MTGNFNKIIQDMIDYENKIANLKKKKTFNIS